MDVKLLKDYNIKNITLKKPEKISNKTIIFNVKYNKTQDLIIQTPKCLVPYIPIIYSHKNINFYTLKVIAHKYEYEESTKEFVTMMQETDNFIKSRVTYFMKKTGLTKKPKFHESTHVNNTNNRISFYFNLQLSENKPVLSIYDQYKLKQNFEYLVPNSNAYSLLWLKNIWVTDGKFGLNWIVLQMKVYLPIYKITECLIQDEEEDIYIAPVSPIFIEKSKVSYKDHEKYSKFFRMKRYKIPVESIKEKMSLEGFDSSIILKDENDFVNENTSKDVNTFPTNNQQISYKDHEKYSKFFRMKRYRVPVESIKEKMSLEGFDSSIILKDENDFVCESKPKISVNKTNGGFLSELGSVRLNSLDGSREKPPLKKKYNTRDPPSLQEIITSRQKLKPVKR